MTTKNYKKIVLDFLSKNSPKLIYDQNFLINEKIIKQLVEAANINKKERVLEIGTGLGFLTEELAKKAREVISIEIDERFKPFLKRMPVNVRLIFGDAYKLFCDKKFTKSLGMIDKIVSNVPYSKAENLLHPLAKGGWFAGDFFWIAPLSLVNKINFNPIFSAYFKAFLLKKLAKDDFYPSPKTSSAIIHFKRIPSPEKTGDRSIFLRRFLYEHEDWKLKNALREGIILMAKKLQNKFISKKQAKGLLNKFQLDSDDLEKYVANINLDLYWQIAEKLIKLA